jgi:hypothetical protein
MNKSIPDFLVVGAAKSGTTSLITDMRKHPEIFTPGIEVNYFSHYYDKGPGWYTAIFKEPGKIQGEKSTSYLFYPVCHERIFNHNPEIKLIILLREPVKRAFSNWTMRYVQHRLLYQAHIFNQQYPNKIENIGFSQLFHHFLSCYSSPCYNNEPLDVFSRGLYINQIESLLQFFKREQILILISENYFRNPVETLSKVSQFLNVDDFPNNQLSWKRKMEYPKKLDESVVSEIHHFYKPYNERLFDFLGFEIPAWKR